MLIRLEKVTKQSFKSPEIRSQTDWRLVKSIVTLWRGGQPTMISPRARCIIVWEATKENGTISAIS